MWIQRLGSRLCTIRPEISRLGIENSPRERGEFVVIVNLWRKLQRHTGTWPKLGTLVEGFDQQGDAERDHRYRCENPQP